MEVEIEVVAAGDDLILIEVTDLEECARKGHRPKRAKAYRIVVDRVRHTVHQHEMTGAAILELVGKQPKDWSLTEKLPDGRRVRIEPQHLVVFHHHAIERFETNPNKVRNGEMPLTGPLSADDRAFLDGMGLPWRLAQDGGTWALVVSGYHLPSGLTPHVTDVMIRIPLHYPVSGLDMFNTCPHVARADRRLIPYLTPVVFQGAQWQQWSRHRLPEHPWNPATDSVATHFRLMEDALARDAA